MRSLRIRHHRRPPAVRIAADAGVQREIAEEVDGVGGAFAQDALGAEDGGAVGAVRTGEGGHVLDHAEELGGCGLVVSNYGFGSKSWGGGRGRTGTSTLRNMPMPFTASLRAMSWGVETMTAPSYMLTIDINIQDEDIQSAPIDVVKELLQALHHHKPAPDHGRFFVDEIAH
ncbi:MAG: hypothetical protein Q9187_008527 [Circinaria calcarea]